MLSLARLAVVGICASAIAAGCASTMNVSSHAERGVNFARYGTYDWGRADILPTADPRLDKNPSFHDRMQGAVEKQMAAKGFKQSSWRPDILVHYHANVARRINADELEREQANCYSDDARNGRVGGHTDGCLAEVPEYDAGTLVLDIIDARTKKVIWRGWAQDNFDGVIGDPDKLGKKIDEAVKRMVRSLPMA